MDQAIGSLADVWRLICVPIESLQLASVFFDVNIPWSISLFEDFFDDVVKLRLYVVGDGFIPLFLLACCSILFFIALVLVECCLEDCLESCLSLFWEKLGNEIWFGLLFVPMFSLILEIFRCEDSYLAADSDIKCWEGVHAFYVCLAVLSAVAMVLVVAWKAPESNRKAKKQCKVKKCQERQCKHKKRLLRIAPHENYVDTKYVAYRMVAIALGVAITGVGHIAQLVLCSLALAAGLYPFLLYVSRVPHVAMPVNYFKAAFHLGTWWAILCAFVAIAVDDPGSDVSGILLALWPVAVLAGLGVAIFRVKVMVDCCDLNLAPQEDAWALDWAQKNRLDRLGIRQRPFKYQAEDLKTSEDALSVEISVCDKETVEAIVEIIKSSDVEQQQTPVRGIILQPNAAFVPQNTLNARDVLGSFYELLESAHPTVSSMASVSVNGFVMTTADVQRLTRALAKHQHLVELDLFNNAIADAGAQAAAEAAVGFQSPKFVKLNLGGNAVGAPTKVAIERLCKGGRPGLGVDLF
uniref:Uncharacterized protein n=1 Tax=Heterosigma akashiwo TaxID=2829 RepID=A0A6V1UPU1_HETAK|mmetsp:Transcript_1887/g.2481  ORF Transcript_1887/g.2481 Transcript_1887/m.2481 type:complete len:523 (-) Transcript_1887:114-1682(-)